MITLAFRFLLLIISLCGFFLYFSSKMKAELCIGFVFSAIGYTMFIAGILNILPETALCIFIAGFACLAVSFRKKIRIKNIISCGTVFFAILVGGLFILLYNAKFTHYDDFSHWATATKVLLYENRFPNFSNQNVGFQSYPLGYASFIYYVCHIVGSEAEWMQSLTQAVFMAGMLISLFVFCKTSVSKIAAMLVSVFLLCGNTMLTSLLVDTLLPIAALGAFCFCYFYIDQIADKKWYMVFYLAYLISIKNSAAIFIVTIILFLIFKSSKEVRCFRTFAPIILSPVLTFFLWIRHAELVFGPSALTSKHSMTTENLSAVFRQKSPETILKICKAFSRTVLSKNNSFLFLLLIGLGIIAIYIYSGYSGKLLKSRDAMALVLFAFSFYALYLLGTLGMYLFSMPAGESMGSFQRYHRTGLIFIAGILFIASAISLNSLAQDAKKVSAVIGSVLCVCFILLGIKPDFRYLKRRQPDGVQRYAFEQAIGDYDIPKGKACLILEKNESGGSAYIYFLSRYLLEPSNTNVYIVYSLENGDEDWHDFDYLITYDHNVEIDDYLQKTFGTTESVIDLSVYKD